MILVLFGLNQPAMTVCPECEPIEKDNCCESAKKSEQPGSHCEQSLATCQCTNISHSDAISHGKKAAKNALVPVAKNLAAIETNEFRHPKTPAPSTDQPLSFLSKSHPKLFILHSAFLC